jgi:hypothetical protein
LNGFAPSQAQFGKEAAAGVRDRLHLGGGGHRPEFGNCTSAITRAHEMELRSHWLPQSESGNEGQPINPQSEILFNDPFHFQLVNNSRFVFIKNNTFTIG